MDNITAIALFGSFFSICLLWVLLAKGDDNTEDDEY